MVTKSPTFAMAVCTVDGQQFEYGDVDTEFPLMESVKPLLYALALKDCGKARVHEVGVGELTTDTGSCVFLFSCC